MQLAIGDVLEGKVTGITKFGAFVELEPGKTGMVHISEVSTDYVEDISQYLKKGPDGQGESYQYHRRRKDQSLHQKGDAKRTAPRAAQCGRQGWFQNFGNRRYDNSSKRPFNPQQVSSYEWNPRKNESASFEDMLNKFKQTSDDKMSDLKKYRGEVKRGSANRRSRQD